MAVWHAAQRPALRHSPQRCAARPRISIRLRIDAGSLHEREDRSGYAHFIEHLTFRGSPFRPDGRSNGYGSGSASASARTATPRQRQLTTTYALDLPDASSESVEESIKILAGMMSDPNIVPAAVEAERAVVLAEMREGQGAASRVGDASRALFFARAAIGQPCADPLCPKPRSRERSKPARLS